MLWVNALRMIVLPLVVSHIVLAIAASAGRASAGRVGALSLFGFLALLAAAAAFTMLVGLPLVNGLAIDPATQAQFREHAGIAAAASSGPVEQSGTFTEWLLGLLPTNVFRAAANDEVLPVLIASVLFAIAVSRIGADQRAIIVGFFEAVRDATHVLVGWILVVLPIGVFAVALPLTAETGFEAAGLLGWFVLVVCALLIGFTFILYPITALLGRVSMSRFAWGVAPSQAVAMGSRSSLATLPALMEGADKRLGVPTEVGSFVLPLAVSAFKVNRTISSPLKLLFLAHVYGITLDPGTVALFIPTVMLLSFSSPGIPSGGFLVTMPFYLAAGIPVEGIVLLKAVDAVPDIFKTLVNVTADMSVATIVARFVGMPAGAAAPAVLVPMPADVVGATPAAP
jgi:Na+/H+-dicarboxylate symporter